jgi:PAS domain S-box-containing protein
MPKHRNASPIQRRLEKLRHAAGAVVRRTAQSLERAPAPPPSADEFRVLERVAALTHNAVVLTDRDACTMWVNEGFTRITGYTLDEVRGRKPGHFLQGGKTDPYTVEIMRRAIEAGEGFDVEILNYAKDGREYWLRIEAQPLLNDFGEVTNFIAIEADITQRRLDEERLRESRRLYQAALSGNLDAVFIYRALRDKHGRIHDFALLDMNQRAEREVGRPRGDLIGKSLHVVLPAANYAEFFAEYVQVITTNEPVEGEATLHLPKGPRTFQRQIVPIDEGVAVFVRDITERRATENALRRSEALLHRTQRLANLGGWEYDAQTGTYAFTEQARHILGLGDDAAVAAERFFERFAGAARQTLQTAITAALAGGSGFSHELSLDDGRRGVWVRVEGTPNAADGQPGLSGILQDVTERRAFESEIIERQARLRAVLSSVAEAVVSIDEAGNILEVNDSTLRMFGYTEADLLGANVSVLMPEPFHSAHDGYLRRYMSEGKARIMGYGRVVVGRRSDGSVFPIHLAVKEILTASGRMFTGTIRDLTSEQQSRELRARLESILEASPDYVAMTDETGRIVYLNRASRSLFQVDPSTGQPGSLLSLHAEGTRRALLTDIIPQAFERGVGVMEGELMGADGRVVPVMESVMAHKMPIGDGYFLSLIARDISELKRIERVKTELVSTVSHELRTPLTSIRGILGLVSSGVAGEVSPEAAEMLQVAVKNAERLNRLISDFLDLDKIESGNMNIPLGPFELQPLVEQAILDALAYARPAGVDVVLVQGLPGVIVHANADRTSQVLANLLSNAVKFSPRSGAVTVTLGTVAGVARISVHDQGPGIPESFQGFIFQKFAQADASDTRIQQGSGLGLSISKALVERMGGHIGFVSAPETGTTFHVDLPMVGDVAL